MRRRLLGEKIRKKEDKKKFCCINNYFSNFDFNSSYYMGRSSDKQNSGRKRRKNKCRELY